METRRAVTLLTNSDCFAITANEKNRYDSYLRNHNHIEIKLILNGGGLRRIVGNHIGETGDSELVCIGPNLTHGWLSTNNPGKVIREVTIQFHRDLLDESFLNKNQLVHIQKLFENSKRGILFSKCTIDEVKPLISDIDKKVGFDSILGLLAILNCLSVASDCMLLSDAAFSNNDQRHVSRRIENVFKFMNTNFEKRLTLADAARIANMAPGSFSRFIKHHTGKSFVGNLNEIRVGNVNRMLIHTSHSISEIAYKCGFDNLTNFYRIFRKTKGITPKEFRNCHFRCGVHFSSLNEH